MLSHFQEPPKKLWPSWRASRVRHSGFTLIELLVVVAVAAILTGVAIPSFMQMIQNNRQAFNVNSLIGGFGIARNESVKRGGHVAICPSTDGAACGGSWADGWLVWQDNDSAGTTGTVDTSEQVIRVGESLAGVSSASNIGWSRAQSYVPFSSQGLSAVSGSIVLCDSRGSDHAKSLTISVAGRAYVNKRLSTGSNLSC